MPIHQRALILAITDWECLKKYSLSPRKLYTTLSSTTRPTATTFILTPHEEHSIPNPFLLHRVLEETKPTTIIIALAHTNTPQSLLEKLLNILNRNTILVAAIISTCN